MKKIVILLLLAGVIGGGVYYYKSQPFQEKTQVHLKAIRGDLKIEINSYGTLHAKNSLKIKSGLPGTNKITYLIEEGSRVKKGDILARFETTNFIKQIESLENSVLQNRTSHKTNLSSYEIGISEGQDRIEKAELEMNKASMQLEKYIKGDQPLEERQFKILRDESDLDYKRKKDRFDQLPKLLEEGFITQIEYETEELQLKSSKIRKESDQLKLDLYLKYTKPQGLLDKKNNLKNFTNALVRVKKQVEAKNAQLDTQLKQAKRVLGMSEEKLKEWNEYMEKSTLTSPAEGIVIIGNSRSRHSEPPKVDSSINENSTLFNLPDLSTIEVNTLIHESEIEQIKMGQICTVTVDAANNRSYEGTITKIATIANTGNWRKGSDIKEFSITVEITERNPEVRPGTSARVLIHIDQLKEVIMVPTYAIVKTKEETYCLVLENGIAVKRFVTPGRHNISFTEIKSGIKEGEIILLDE